MQTILCIIPARSGSKGIPDKNIKLFSGKPLLAWSIYQAINSKFQMRVVVSTDSPKYADIARYHGAEVPILRPSSIAEDLSSDYECIDHMVNWLSKHENYNPDIILQLRPTSPLRKIETIDCCLDLFIENMEKYDSLRTVIPVDKSPYKMYTIVNDVLCPLFSKVGDITEPYNQCRQCLPKCYLHNGYIDIFKTTTLDSGSISGNKIYPYVMNESDTNDIDNINDWNNASNFSN